MATSVRKWLEKSRELVFQKYSRKIEKVVFALPDNTESDLYIKSEGKTVCVLAITKDKKVILVRQFRPGPNMILAELPGGFVRDGEEPQDIATKELLEETGYTGKLTFVTSCWDDAYSTMERFCFVATNCEKSTDINNSLSDDFGDDHGHSEIKEVVVMPIPDFRQLLRSGQITDVEVGYLGLDFLGFLQ